MQTSSFTQVVVTASMRFIMENHCGLEMKQEFFNDLHPSVIRFHITRENEVQVKAILNAAKSIREGKELLCHRIYGQAFKEEVL